MALRTHFALVPVTAVGSVMHKKPSVLDFVSAFFMGWWGWSL